MRGPDPSQVSLLVLLLESGKPEITKLDSPVVLDKNILTFQVAMHDLLVVKIVHSHCNLLCKKVNSLSRKSLSLLMQQSEQRSFRHVLCDHIVLVLIIK